MSATTTTTEAVAVDAAGDAAPPSPPPKHVLYDIPVSNNGARVRMILYYKNVPESEVSIESPSALGGHRSEAYAAVNPQCKIPALRRTADDVCFGESDTIARYVGGRYDGRDGPGRFAPAPGSDEALLADRIARLHDVYLAAIQGCLYKASPYGQGFAMHGTRAKALDAFQKQLETLETMLDDEPARGGQQEGPYLLGGTEPTLADVAVFPTLVFAERMLPKFEGRSFALGPRLSKWWAYMTSGADAVAARVRTEIVEALDGWEARDRWGDVLGAGLRDDDPPTVFSKIVDKEIPADVVYEDDDCLAFRDLNPVAPVHVLLIPKRRDRLTQLRYATDDHGFILGHLMTKVPKVAELAGLDAYRLVVNDGAGAGQSVFHLHLHIIGGRDLSWPPG